MARARSRRRRRRLFAAAAVAGLAGIGWAVLASPWATVGRIEVVGAHRVDSAQLRGLGADELGRPMLLARTDTVARRVRALRLVRSVDVRRSWPSTLRIRVVEREPAAAVPGSSAADVRLVDPDGVLVEHARAVPAGLPLLQVLPERAGPGAVGACLSVLRALPPAVRAQMRAIGADSPNAVWLRLAGGARVAWGDSADGGRKAAVLLALLPQHAVAYDVRSPDAPTVRTQ